VIQQLSINHVPVRSEHTPTVETDFGTMVPKSWMAPWRLVPFEKLAPVPALFQNWHSANRKI